MAPVYIGFATGIVCYLALGLKKAFGFDDSLDVVAVHLVGGLFGSIVLGLFADAKVNAVVTHPGLFISGGGIDLLLDQAEQSHSSLAAGERFHHRMSLTNAELVPVRPDERQAPAGRNVRIDADHWDAGGDGSVGEHAHQADPPAAVDQPDAALGEHAPKLRGCCGVRRIVPRTRATKDAEPFHVDALF